ncbi:MAG: hypothetical protein COC19_01905, partial [SAR86 cluster bacterium]
MKKILILGATSAIAIETARLYAQQGCSLFLAARDEQKLITLSKDLIVRGANTVGHCLFDANQFDQHQSVCENALQFLGQLDIVLICHGSLPDQQRCAEDFNEAQLAINTNGLSVISLLRLFLGKKGLLFTRIEVTETGGIKLSSLILLG